MGIIPRYTRQDIKKLLAKRVEAINRAIILQLCRLGEMCVNHAREIGPETGFHDQTGNLRSSIGYVVYQDGREVDIKFDRTVHGDRGMIKGMILAREIAGKYPRGFVLVVVAGMDYALHVESCNRDVLSSAEHLAEEKLPGMLKQIDTKIKKKFQK